MKKIIMLKGDYCPYCQRAFRYMNELYEEHPEYKELDVEMIDEVTQEELSNQYDYEVVPTYLIDGQIVFAGIPTKDEIERVFKKAME